MGHIEIIETQISLADTVLTRSVPRLSAHCEIDNLMVAGLHQEILEYTKGFNDAQTSIEAGFFRKSLEDSLAQLKGVLKGAQGVMSLTVPKAYEKYSRLQPLFSEFGAAESGVKSFVIDIPKEKITAVNALPFPSTEVNEYHPVLDLRVQKVTDSPLQVYEGPGQPKEVPSCGTWHRFPLEFVGIQII